MQNDVIELVESTFQKVKDVIIINKLNKVDNYDLIEEDLLEAKELLIKGIEKIERKF